MTEDNVRAAAKLMLISFGNAKAGRYPKKNGVQVAAANDSIWHNCWEEDHD